jgi:hypothetical protein
VIRLAVTLASALALAACGGDDEDDSKEAQDTVREFIRATNDRDAEAFCGEVVSDAFLEQLTGAKGDRAEKLCEDQIKVVKSPRLELVRITKAEIDGEDAEVSARIKAQGQTRDQVFRLKEEDGGWRIAGGAER